MGPIEGWLTDKLGTRRMVLIGFLILGVGFLIFWQVNSLWMFYLAFIVMALGQGLGSWLPMMTCMNNWFARRRSTAMGWANVERTARARCCWCRSSPGRWIRRRTGSGGR